MKRNTFGYILLLAFSPFTLPSSEQTRPKRLTGQKRSFSDTTMSDNPVAGSSFNNPSNTPSQFNKETLAPIDPRALDAPLNIASFSSVPRSNAPDLQSAGSSSNVLPGVHNIIGNIASSSNEPARNLAQEINSHLQSSEEYTRPLKRMRVSTDTSPLNSIFRQEGLRESSRQLAEATRSRVAAPAATAYSNMSYPQSETPLHDAVHDNNIEMAQLLIQNGADVNIKESQWGATPLHHAAYINNLPIAQLLIENKANINTKDNEDATPLHKAAQNNNIDIAQLLIDNNAEVNSKDQSGFTPLHIAVQYNNLETVQLLIKNGADVSIKESEWGANPLHTAVKNNNLEMAQTLIENDADVNSRDLQEATPLHHAVHRNNLNIAQLLLENGADVNAKYENMITPLYLAVSYDYLEIAKLLIAKRANIDTRYLNNYTVLHQAVDKNSTQMVELLVQHGADINARTRYGTTPLMLAQMAGKFNVARILEHYAQRMNYYPPAMHTTYPFSTGYRRY